MTDPFGLKTSGRFCWPARIARTRQQRTRQQSKHDVRPFSSMQWSMRAAGCRAGCAENPRRRGQAQHTARYQLN